MKLADATISTVSIALPSDIPAPKFRLFQRVSYGNNYPVTGIITGMNWVDFNNALIHSLESFGWQYTVSRTFNASPKELLKLSEDCTDEVAWEDELRLTGEEAA